MAFHPTAELAAKIWILGISNVPANSCATTLPEDRTTWVTNGFIQIAHLGGDPELHVKKRKSVIDITCWFQGKPGSDRPPWNKAAQLAEIVFDGGYVDPLTVQRLLVLPTAYNNARVLSFMPTEPERRGADESGNAAFGFEAMFEWIEVPK